MPQTLAANHPIILGNRRNNLSWFLEMHMSNLPQTIVPWTEKDRVYIEDRHQYVIKSRLPSGGFGHTYLADHPVTKEQVVIKTPNDTFWQTFGAEPCVNQFLKEVVTMATFKNSKNPHLVKLITTGLVNGVPTIVMEYVPGQTLYQRGANFTEAQALKYTRQVGSALTELHETGIVHRDVKHLNIIIREPTDEAVLLDFGIARSFLTLQHVPQGGGTPGFADPDGTTDARFDVYSLAVTLHWMITGYSPQELKVVDFSVMSAATQQAIRQATASPDRRTKSIAAFLAALPLLSEDSFQGDFQGESGAVPEVPPVKSGEGARFSAEDDQKTGTPSSFSEGKPTPSPSPEGDRKGSNLTIFSRPLLLGGTIVSVIALSFVVAFGMVRILTGSEPSTAPEGSGETFLSLTGQSIGMAIPDDRWEVEPSDPQASFGRDTSILKLKDRKNANRSIKVEEFPLTFDWATALDPYSNPTGFSELQRETLTVNGHHACQVQYIDRPQNLKYDRLIIPTATAVYVATSQAPVNQYDKAALKVLTTLTLPDAPYAQPPICP